MSTQFKVIRQIVENGVILVGRWESEEHFNRYSAGQYRYNRASVSCTVNFEGQIEIMDVENTSTFDKFTTEQAEDLIDVLQVAVITSKRVRAGEFSEVLH